MVIKNPNITTNYKLLAPNVTFQIFNVQMDIGDKFKYSSHCVIVLELWFHKIVISILFPLYMVKKLFTNILRLCKFWRVVCYVIFECFLIIVLFFEM